MTHGEDVTEASAVPVGNFGAEMAFRVVSILRQRRQISVSLYQLFIDVGPIQQGT